MKTYIFLFVSLLLWSCQNPSKPLSEKQKEKYLKIGDSLTAETQKILLKNVSEQIASNGVANAVNFCSEKAISLTKTFADNTIEISRVSNKNRNPENNLKTPTDQQTWDSISAAFADSFPKETAKHIILEDDNQILYYKAIPLAMPTCLACHGNKQTNITPEVQQIITQKYPNDKATDYEIGQLRGLWKVVIKNN